MKRGRINLILILIILFGVAIIGRLFFIQILHCEYWKALAQGQQKFFAQIQGNRGEIFLQNKEGNLYTLALNKNWELVYISPEEITTKGEDSIETAKALSRILNLDEDLILEKIKKSGSLYELIKNKLTQEEIDLLKKLNLPGVYLGSETLRYYPQETLASHLVGFLGGDNIGQYGVEGYYNDILKGSEGFQEGEKGAQGYLVKMTSGVVKGGTDLILTFDYNIQFMAEKLLREAKENLDIEGGQIIVGDPNSGKILALANFPNFNPNQYWKESNLEIFQNGASQKLFEPGSVFKPITMAAALDQGVITPQTTYIDPGIIEIGGWSIYNYDERVWGERTMTEVLEKSINTGAVFAGRQIAHQTFLDYIEKFGFFEPTGIDLQGEVFSTNSNLKKGYEVNFATASFGQGIEMTPLQLFRAICAIANGGKLIKPYVLENPGPNLDEIKGKQIISQKTATQLTAMLVSVIENGFGKSAKIPGYYIAGKTGTAQISFSALEIDKSGYSEKTIQTFAGFVPAFNPRFLILIKLDNPKARTAEYSATPIFRELAKYIIDYYQIPPDYDYEE
ncbi:MAG: peptidoglycan D,D-transpeptidase FtsI family protein [Candidatus Nealsonbacteria bacterium]